MFDSLSEKLQRSLKVLKGQGKLTEKNVQDTLREVRLALLEADVNFQVAKDFIAHVKAKAMGHEVLNSVSPAQQFVKVIHDELVETFGSENKKLDFSASPTVIMMCGLQGSGKTTSAAKLALHLKEKQNKKPLLAAADIYRPAAIKQLQLLAEQVGVPCVSIEDADPVKISKEAVAEARRTGRDVVILDTAGRLQIDTELIDELKHIVGATKPGETLFVADAMTGQEAVNVAQGFHEAVGITGVVLTKMDGDARGGAALSIHHITGQPLKFIGVGEKVEAFEPFHPDRMAGRILGMGDIVSLVERAQDTVDADQAERMAQKMLSADFTLEDFLEQMQQLRKMGPLQDIMGMIPGMEQAMKGQAGPDEKEMKKVEAIIQSMTLKERRKPKIINGSRKKRISSGSGTTAADVNRLLKQFKQAQKMMKGLTKKGKKGRRMALPGLGGPSMPKMPF